MSYIPGLSPFAADRARPYLPVSRQLGSLCWLSASFSFLFFSLPPPTHPSPIHPLSREIATERSRRVKNLCSRKIQKLVEKPMVFSRSVNFRGIEARFETLHRGVLPLHFFQFSSPSLLAGSSRKTTQAISCFHACETRPRVRRDTVQQFSKPVRRMKIVDGRHSTGE